MAAEKLGQQWIGIDIWDKAHEIVIDRLRKESFLAGPDGDMGGLLIAEGQITYTTEPPTRTDGAEHAVPRLKTIECIDEPPGQKLSRKEMLDYLLRTKGSKC